MGYTVAAMTSCNCFYLKDRFTGGSCSAVVKSLTSRGEVECPEISYRLTGDIINVNGDMGIINIARKANNALWTVMLSELSEVAKIPAKISNQKVLGLQDNHDAWSEGG